MFKAKNTIFWLFSDFSESQIFKKITFIYMNASVQVIRRYGLSENSIAEVFCNFDEIILLCTDTSHVAGEGNDLPPPWNEATCFFMDINVSIC